MGKRKQKEQRSTAFGPSDLVYMRRFRHPPLPSPQTHIRLLDVLPPSSAGVLRCRLRPVSLVGEPVPEYTALSYEWGSDEITHRILVNSAPFSIRLNLWRLLDNLGRTDLATRGYLPNIWVDAISINQQDNRERNHQVQLMKLIYTKAIRTIVWLPDPENLHQFGYWVHAALRMETSRLMKTSREIGERKDQDQILGSSLHQKLQKSKSPPVSLSRGTIFGRDADKHRAPLTLVQDFVETADENINVDFRPITPLYHIRDHSYWSRLWIVQEFVLSREVTILFEDGPIPWSTCEAALNWNEAHCYNPDGLLPMLRDMRSLSSSQLFDIGQLLTVFQGSKCVDPRDKVFGLAGLAEKGDTFPIDYNDDIRVVFFKTLAHFQGTYHQSPTGDILTALKTALGLPSGIQLLHYSLPVANYLTTRIKIPVSAWSGEDLKNIFSTVGKCRCSQCYQMRRPTRKEFSAFVTKWWVTDTRLCLASSLDSILVLMFKKSKLSTWEFYAAAYMSPDERPSTLLFHDTGLGSLSCTTYNGDTQGTIEVEPEVLDAIIFRYSGALAKIGGEPHMFLRYLNIWPIEKSWTATERTKR